MLTVKSLNQSYNQSHILWDISFSLNSGSRCALLGRNGVGKTTLVRSILGFLAISSGEIYLSSSPITHIPSYQRSRLGISHVPQGRGIFSRLTVEENLRSAIQGLPLNSEQHFIYEYFPDLKTFSQRPAGYLSGGQQQQLSIARALLQKPRLLILDEPTEGIQPNIVDQIGEIIVALNEEKGISIFTVEQKVSFVRAYHDSFLIMDKGRLVSGGQMEEFSEDLIEKYLMV